MDLRSGIQTFDAAAGLAKLHDFPFGLLSWVGDDGYPITAAIDLEAIDSDARTIRFAPPAGLVVPTDREVSVTASHIRPQPGIGYDERRHVTVWGRARISEDRDRMVFEGAVAWGWNEQEIPFPEYNERTVGQGRRYLERVSEEVGRVVRPRLSGPWLALRATRLPFLTAAIIPVLIGIAMAAVDGSFDAVSALLTIVGAATVQLGLNVANDIFDTRSGADDANVTPTQYSGGSRVIQYGLVSLGGMARISAAMYAITLAIGLILLATRGSVALLVIGVLGIILSIGYTAPPLKLVYRGLGELTTAIGFGPLMLVGAYVVQTQGAITTATLVASIPIAILIGLILYVNEIPDRPGDARAGKRTLPVRLPQPIVIAAYAVAVAIAFLAIVGGVAFGVLPVTVLIALVTLPLAARVYRGLQTYYDQPYGMMAIMATNIRLHLMVGLLMFAAYLVVIVATAVAPSVSLFLR